MAAAGLQRMMDGYEREKQCSDLKEPKGFICVSSTGFAGGAPSPDLSGMIDSIKEQTHSSFASNLSCSLHHSSPCKRLCSILLHACRVKDWKRK